MEEWKHQYYSTSEIRRNDFLYGTHFLINKLVLPISLLCWTDSSTLPILTVTEIIIERISMFKL